MLCNKRIAQEAAVNNCVLGGEYGDTTDEIKTDSNGAITDIPSRNICHTFIPKKQMNTWLRICDDKR